MTAIVEVLTEQHCQTCYFESHFRNNKIGNTVAKLNNGDLIWIITKFVRKTKL